MGVGYYDLRTQSGSRVNEPQAFIGINIPIYDGGLRAKPAFMKRKLRVESRDNRQTRMAIDTVTPLDVHQAYLAKTEAVDEVVESSASLQALVRGTTQPTIWP